MLYYYFDILKISIYFKYNTFVTKSTLFIRNSGDIYHFLFLNHILHTYNKNKNHVLFVYKNISL